MAGPSTVYAVTHADYRAALVTINNDVMRRARNNEPKSQQKVGMILRFRILAMTGRDPKWIEFSDLSFKEVGPPPVPVPTGDTEPFVPIPQGCGCECPGCDDQGRHCHKTHEGCYL